MEEFLLKTIWGIIILGAIGSIIAIAILNIFKKLLRKIFSKERQLGILGNLLKPTAESRAQTFFLLKQNDNTGFMCYLVDKFTSYVITTTLLFLSFMFLALYFIIVGLQITIYLAVIISFIFLSLKWWWKSVLKGLGIILETYDKKSEEVNRLMKDINPTSSAILALKGFDKIMEEYKNKKKIQNE